MTMPLAARAGAPPQAGRRITIGAGEWCLDRAPAVLETFLGSCVGVALYDHAVQIGGLLHIVLPAGLAKREEASPTVYASRGIPYLVQALVDAGASRRRLVASLAGGASIRTPRGKGADLMIGQRNVLAVRAALAAEGIPVRNEDVGQDFGRHLALDLEDGRVSVRGTRRAANGAQPPPGQALAIPSPRLAEVIDRLQPISEIAFQALELARDPDSSFFAIERLVLKDPVLAATVLKLANSAWLGLPLPVTSVSQALSLLGLARFRRLVLQATVHDLFARELRAYSMASGALFRHAVACAQLADLLLPDRPVREREEAYVAGLLHDLGKVVLERCAWEAYAVIAQRALSHRESFHQAEREILGLDHGEAGHLLADLWRLPAGLGEAIALHHEPLRSRAGRPLVCAVHVADALCQMLGIDLARDSLAYELEPAALAALRLDDPAVEAILAEVPRILYEHV
ncbi:MAG: HDOD domain-containing protein [Thermodesulfobacteriota bacterium]